MRQGPPKSSQTSSPGGLRRLEGNGFTDDEVELGFISGVFGVQGELRLFLHNEESATLDKPRRVILLDGDGNRHEATLSARSGAGKRVLGELHGLVDRNLAYGLKDWKFGIAIADLPDPADDEFYVYELEGLAAWVGEREVGTIVGVHPTPGGDILEIELPGNTAFVPAIARFVLDIDLDAGIVRLTDDALAEDQP